MTANHDLERRLADFYATEAPLAGARLGARAGPRDHRQHHTAARAHPRAVEVPTMNSFAKLAVAAVVVIAVGRVGLAVLRPGPGPTWAVRAARLHPRHRHRRHAASTSPGPSVSPLPALTETFTSAMHGISVSYPSGWKLRPATEPWTSGHVLGDSTFADIIYEKESDSPFIAVASQPLAGKTLDAWATDYLAQFSCVPTEPVTVDGATGVLSDCPEGPHALVSVEGRGYLIWLYRVDDPAWFPAILATVQLHPEDAL